MGKPMASNLLKAGFAVTVFNRSRPAMDALAAEGATLAASPAEVGRACSVVITMVPDSPDVEAVLLGPDGVCTAAKPGTLLIDMSTIAPAAVRRIHETVAAKGFRMLDAPVSGGDVGAKAGTLSIMVGGTPEDFERARPVFAAMGKTITLCGPAGAGQLVKACNQIVGALVLNAISEALVFGRAAGVDPEIMIRVLQGGVAATRAMEVRGARMAAGDFAPGFKAAHHLKDLRIVIDEGKAMGLTLPTTSSVADMLATLVDRPKVIETTALGAALLAGVGCGDCSLGLFDLLGPSAFGQLVEFLLSGVLLGDGVFELGLGAIEFDRRLH
jgi:2-hydroxy-3-oxopropionate reductase